MDSHEVAAWSSLPGMYLFLELWTPNARWRALPRDEREGFVSHLSAGMMELSSQGVEPVAWGWADKLSRSDEHTTFAVWRCSSAEALAGLRAAVASCGWYEYFDQADVGGEVSSPTTVLAAHVALT